MKPKRSLRCPTCRALVLAGVENFPFCSDRCRLIDLGKWASGGYVVSTPADDPEQLESMHPEDGDTAQPEGGQKSHYRDTRKRRHGEDPTSDPDCRENS